MLFSKQKLCFRNIAETDHWAHQRLVAKFHHRLKISFGCAGRDIQEYAREEAG